MQGRRMSWNSIIFVFSIAEFSVTLVDFANWIIARRYIRSNVGSSSCKSSRNCTSNYFLFICLFVYLFVYLFICLFACLMSNKKKLIELNTIKAWKSKYNARYIGLNLFWCWSRCRCADWRRSSRSLWPRKDIPCLGVAGNGNLCSGAGGNGTGKNKASGQTTHFAVRLNVWFWNF